MENLDINGLIEAAESLWYNDQLGFAAQIESVVCEKTVEIKDKEVTYELVVVMRVK